MKEKRERNEKRPTMEISPELVAEARDGDQAAFAELYELTSPVLYRTIRSMIRDEDLAWDILQDCYLRAFRNLDKLGADEAFLPWLRRIAVNETARQMSKRLPINFSDLPGDENGNAWEPEIPDLSIGSQPELALDRKETSRLVREILSSLSEQQQLIIGMRYYENMSVAEISDLLHIAPGTVKAQLFKGRKSVEIKVRALEDQGVKLYGMSPLPFLIALFRSLSPTRTAGQRVLAVVLAQTPAAGTVTASAATGGTAIAAAGGTAVNMTAMTAGQAFLHGLTVKLLSGALAVALIGGGLWAGGSLLKKSFEYGPVQPIETRAIRVTEDSTESEPSVTEAESTAPEETEPAPETSSPVGFLAKPNEAPSTEAPPEPSTQAPAEAPTEPLPESSEEPPAEPLPEPPAEPLPEPTPTDIREGPGDVTVNLHQAGSIYVGDGIGYSPYYFSEANSGRFCEAVNGLAKTLEGKAQVFSLICPISSGVMLSDETRSSIRLSDQNKSIGWIYEHMDPLVKPVPVYGALKLHNDEYIYFRTDHHWTALGAYYAYREFCAQKRICPHQLSDFERFSYSDFQGTFISYSQEDEELMESFDTLTSYVPNGTNQMTVWLPYNDTYLEREWHIVKDASAYGHGSYYLGFLGGDQPYSFAHNETVADGSSVLIVKDSYANDFIPFLIDHYEYIYWIDYHSYSDWCAWHGEEDDSVSGFVERNNIQDVILCNIIGSTGSNINLTDIERIYR